MTNALDALKAAVDTRYEFGGRPDPGIKLLPGMSDYELSVFEKGLPGVLPLEVKCLLRYARGFRSSWSGEVNFTGVGGAGGNEWFSHLFERGVTIASNEAKDSWFLAVDAEGCWGGVYYLNREFGTVIKQSDGLADFIEQVRDWGVLQEDSYFIYIVEKRVNDVYDSDGCEVSYEEALGSQDPVVSNFASWFDENYFFVDLRFAPTGSGFSFCDNDHFTKYAGEPLWAIRRSYGCIMALVRSLYGLITKRSQ